MNKLIFKLFFLVLFFVIVQPAFATSGCCSGHSGVSCGAGPQSNGNVICNDGWTGSSCSYSSMVMCGGSTSSSAPVQQVVSTPTNTPVPMRVYPTSTPIPTKKLLPTWTPKPTRTPTPTRVPTRVITPTNSPTPTFTPTPSPTVTPVHKETISANNQKPNKTGIWGFFLSLFGINKK